MPDIENAQKSAQSLTFALRDLQELNSSENPLISELVLPLIGSVREALTKVERISATLQSHPEAAVKSSRPRAS